MCGEERGGLKCFSFQRGTSFKTKVSLAIFFLAGSINLFPTEVNHPRVGLSSTWIDAYHADHINISTGTFSRQPPGRSKVTFAEGRKQ